MDDKVRFGTPMTPSSSLLESLIGVPVVIDFESSYVCIGTLVTLDAAFLELSDADLHDLRDSKTGRETYVIDSLRLGIRRNRKRILVRLTGVVAIARLSDVAED